MEELTSAPFVHGRRVRRSAGCGGGPRGTSLKVNLGFSIMTRQQSLPHVVSARLEFHDEFELLMGCSQGQTVSSR